MSNYQFEEIKKNEPLIPKITFVSCSDSYEQIDNDTDQENELRTNNILVSSSAIITKKRRPSMH